MHNSYIRSRAGLVALIFALIITLVSAVPIPAAESGLTSTSTGLKGKPEVDTTKISLNGRMSTPPTGTGALTRRQDISTNMDDQLVRRGFGSKFKKAVKRVIGANKVKTGGVSKVSGQISDQIPAKLSNKLQKGMNHVNKAGGVMGFIPRRRDFEEEETFQQRDILDSYYFEERDDIALENRENSYFEGIERDIYERYDLD